METELFDRYLREVGRRLPRKQRDDVKAELHSLLMDALQDRLADRGEEEGATDSTAPMAVEDQVAILQELGPPAKVAAQYAPPHRYLIGPRFFDMYLMVAAIVAGAITLSHLVLLLLAVWDAESVRTVVSAFGEVFVENFFGAVLAGLGAVTLTFAILERVLPESKYRARTLSTSPLPIVALERVSSESAFEEDEEEVWDPRTLPEIEDHDRVEVGGLVTGIVFAVLALCVFNLFPEWVGVSFVSSIDGAPAGWRTVPLLAPVFFTTYLPWLNALWVAQIGLSVVLLRQGRWQRATRVADFLLAVLGAFILYQMAFGSSMLTMEAIQPASLRDTLGAILPRLLQVGLIIGFIATIVEAVRKLCRIFRAKPVPLHDLLNVRKLSGQ
jgi:hypothetical protein